MFDRDIFHQVHDQQIMIDRHIGFLEHRGAFILTGRHFVVAGHNGNAELQGF